MLGILEWNQKGIISSDRLTVHQGQPGFHRGSYHSHINLEVLITAVIPCKQYSSLVLSNPAIEVPLRVIILFVLLIVSTKPESNFWCFFGILGANTNHYIDSLTSFKLLVKSYVSGYGAASYLHITGCDRIFPICCSETFSEKVVHCFISFYHTSLFRNAYRRNDWQQNFSCTFRNQS